MKDLVECMHCGLGVEDITGLPYCEICEEEFCSLKCLDCHFEEEHDDIIKEDNEDE